MSKRKAVRDRKRRKTQPARPKTPVQEALEVTWVLKGHLKNAQISYIRVGALLARVRDKELFKELHHPDLETYAEQRLRLGRASLYRYLQVYDWVCKFHKEWLLPKPKGYIPELADVAGLIWIEQKLTEKKQDVKTRATLQELQKKALDGRLRQKELNELRRRVGTQPDALKSFLAKLRLLRMRGSQLTSMPGEVISHLDAAIDILKNARPVQMAGLHLIDRDKWVGVA